MITPSIKHTIIILEQLRQYPSGLSTQDLLEVLDIPRSTFFTLINSLKELGYVEQSEARGPYLAGVKLLAWTRGKSLAERDLLDAFREEASLVRQSSEQNQALDETLILTMPRPHGMLVVEQNPSPHRVRVVYDSGQVIPFVEGAGGAWFSADSHTETARHNGYSLHSSNDTIELSMPITLDGDTATAALLLSAPSARHTGESLLNQLPNLHEMAARISYRLGAPLYAPFDDPSNTSLQPQSDLNEEAIFNFLQGQHVARLACLKPDGSPHVVPVWQSWDGTAFYVAAWEGSLWSDYLDNNPSVSLTVDEPWPPLRRVIVKGQAQPLKEDEIPGGTHALVTSLRKRYLGSQSSEPAIDWRAFRITPDSMRGWRGLAV